MDYTFKKTAITPDKIKAYAHLLSAVFTNTSKFTEDFLTWQYIDNPHGTVVGYDAFHGDVLAGHYVAIPVLYNINGKDMKGLLSLNTVTHEQHRGKGLFTQLANKTYEEAKTQGYTFVIGVANQNSTHGFLKKLGFYLIAPLEVKTGIGRIIYDNKETYKAFPIWNTSSLQWRLNNPESHYYKNKQAIVSKTDKKGIYADLYHGNFDDIDLKAKSPVFKIWMGLANNIKVKGLLIDLPKQLKPSPLNLIFKDLSGQLPNLSKSDILFESLDFDGY